MTLIKGLFLSVGQSGRGPADALRHLNALFCQVAPKGMFISMILGVLDVRARTFTYARAGHSPVVLQRKDAERAEFRQPAGMAIGLAAADRFDSVLVEDRVELRPGDVLVFYTDGYSEAMNRAHEQFGDEELAHAIGSAHSGSAESILERVSERVHQFVGEAERHDDMTMVVVKVPQELVELASAEAFYAEPAASV